VRRIVIGNDLLNASAACARECVWELLAVIGKNVHAIW